MKDEIECPLQYHCKHYPHAKAANTPQHYKISKHPTSMTSVSIANSRVKLVWQDTFEAETHHSQH
jgi:hypothetical protein